MANETKFSGTHEQLRRLLYGFVASLSGRSGNFEPYVRGIKLRVGMVALACIQEAFVAKANGGAGEDGITWPALKKETIAARRVGPADIPGLKAVGITKRTYGFGARRQGAGDLDTKGRLKRGFLTAEQDAKWKRIFATRKVNLMAKHGMGEEAASGRAAAIAWATLKAEGAKTRLEVLGNRHVQIGRDTDRLFNSLSPGVVDPASQPILNTPEELPDRILREEPGAVIVGTNVVYAGKFHATRNLWPISNDLPDPWARRVEDAAKTGVMEAIEMILGGHG